MDAIRIAHRVYEWYSKGGRWETIGKAAVSVLSLLYGLGIIFKIPLIGVLIVMPLYVIGLALIVLPKFGPTVTKVLDLVGVIQLSPQQETVRQGIGLITGIEDKIEFVREFLFGRFT
ncbi:MULTISPECIES: hypothetical protein [Salinibaculum]|uniref:hypothetical protein n=1 Tax=Salinibaculum TaxID=2732368 RepID=UPI0030CD463E